MSSVNLIKTIAVTAEMFGKEFSADAARMLANDLSAYPEQAVLNSLSRCRQELTRFPTISEIVSRIDDGRPGVEEAWAMLPKSESDSVVWTTEMRAAFSVASSLIEDDPIAARMAFKEKYIRAVQDARAERTPVKWEPSLGHSKYGREAVLRDAYAKGRLSLEHVNSLLPEPLTDERVKKLIAQSVKSLT